MSRREVEELLEEQRAEEEAATARAIERGDQCPVCGYSKSEHSADAMNNCISAYEMDSLFVSRVIDAHLQKGK